MQTKDLVSTLKKFDAYPKTLEDFRVKTFGGAAGKRFVAVCVMGFYRILFSDTNLMRHINTTWLNYKRYDP